MLNNFIKKKNSGLIQNVVCVVAQQYVGVTQITYIIYGDFVVVVVGNQG